ncbi:MAG: transcriptional regulator [Thermoproteus sp.]
MHIHLEHLCISILITLLLMEARGARPSLYNVAKETGASIATIYRRALELAKMGLLLKVGRGSYTVTPKGAFYLAAVAIRNGGPDYMLKAAVRRLRADWGLADMSDEEVEAYVKLLLAGLERLGRPPLGFCADDFGRTVQVLLPSKFGGVDIVEVIARHLSVPLEIVKKAERVIARAILEFFPSIKLPDGCKVVVMPFGEYGTRLSVLASYCRINGYMLGLRCSAGKVLVAEAMRRIFQNSEKFDGVA